MDHLGQKISSDSSSSFFHHQQKIENVDAKFSNKSATATTPRLGRISHDIIIVVGDTDVTYATKFLLQNHVSSFY